MTHRASQVPIKAGVDLERTPQILIDCPITGEQAKRLAEERIVIPNEQAVWWHCSACQGWHLNVEYYTEISLRTEVFS